MNQGRMKSIINGLTGTAERVFDVVPVSQSWSIVQIQAELARTNRSMEYRALAGSLSYLTQIRLISEPIRGYFMRAPEKLKAEALDEEVTQPEIKTEKMQMAVVKPKLEAAPPIAKMTPLDLLSEFSGRINVVMGNLSAIARDMDAAALEVAEQLEKSEAKNEKLTQLQQLLKSLG